MPNTSSISTTTNTKQQNKIVYKLARRGKEKDTKDEDKFTNSVVTSASGSVFIIYPNQNPVLVYNIEKEKEKMLRKDIKEILED